MAGHEGVARLATMPRPPMVGTNIWLNLIADTEAFLNTWGNRAVNPHVSCGQLAFADHNSSRPDAMH